jgi:putative inorganic carbon (HCO3(-)) transporter
LCVIAVIREVDRPLAGFFAWTALVLIVGGAGVSQSPALISGAMLAVGVAALVLRRPSVGVAALVILLPMTDLISQRLGGAAAGDAFGAIKDFLLLLVGVAALASKRISLVPKGIIGTLVLIQVFAGIAGVLSGGVAQALYGWRVDFEPLLLVAAVPLVLTPETARRITTLMAGMAQLAGVVAIGTWRLGMEWLIQLGIWPPGSGEKFPTAFFTAGNVTPRAFSPYIAPNEMATTMAVVVGVIVCRDDWSKKRRMALCILPVVAIYLSRSRSGQLGLLTVLVVLAARSVRQSRSGSGSAILSVAGLLGVAALLWKFGGSADNSLRDPSLAGHATSLQDGWQSLLQTPLGHGLGGVGPRAFRYVEHPILAESFLLVIGLEAGILVLALYLYLQLRVFRVLVVDGSMQAFTGVVALAAIAVSQFVLPAMQNSALSYTVWIAVGAALTNVLHRGPDVAPQLVEPEPAFTHPPRIGPR